MNKENSILGITQEIVDLTEETIDPFFTMGGPEELINFVQQTSREIATKHPKLYKLIQNAPENIQISDPLAFGMGVALSYNMLSLSLPEEQKKSDITENALNDFQQKLKDSLMFVDDNPESSSVNLAWFTDKIKSDSRGFSRWLGYMASGIIEKNSGKDFVIGAIFVTMPFYIQGKVAQSG